MTQTRIYDATLHITPDAAEVGSRLVPENTILAVVRGMSLAKEFRVSITKREVAFNQDLKALACKPDVDPVFLFYSLFAQRESIRQSATEASHGTKKLETDTLGRVKIPLPQIQIQKRAAEVASVYDDTMENNRRRMGLLEKAARLLYEEWFVRLRFPGHEHTPVKNGLPEGWERKRLDELVEVNRASLPGNHDGEIEYVDISSVAPGEITETKVLEFRDAPSRARRIVQHGDIIWSCVRPNRRSHAVIWNPPENLIVSTGFAVLTPKAAQTSFIYYASSTDAFVGYLENHAKGAAYPAVVAGDFERARIVMPPSRLLQAFDETVEPIFSQIHNLHRQNQKLRAARDLLLPRLMSGEIEV